jgi:hypothetical protein
MGERWDGSSEVAKALYQNPHAGDDMTAAGILP